MLVLDQNLYHVLYSPGTEYSSDTRWSKQVGTCASVTLSSVWTD